jgi:hypothetical protein
MENGFLRRPWNPLARSMEERKKKILSKSLDSHFPLR